AHPSCHITILSTSPAGYVPLLPHGNARKEEEGVGEKGMTLAPQPRSKEKGKEGDERRDR
ncbi:MAG TPA: hypothetical protein VHS28_03285, partial [Chloroflexota bacterium]|nr:hypothetical protein [Chloroflexota bacterium]